MSSWRTAFCIALVYLSGFGVPDGAIVRGAGQHPPKLSAAPDPDELYRRRADFTLAKQAITIWTERAMPGRDFESAWKLARVRYYLGTMGPGPERRDHLERGIAAGKLAVDLQPTKPDGHFWYAANMGALAEFGLGTGLKYRGSIRDELEKVIAIEPGWQGGSAESALGQWYARVPWLFGGRHDKAIELLRRAVSYDSENSQAKYNLAEVLAEERATVNEAKSLLRQVLDAPIDPDWAVEDRYRKTQAADLLAKLDKKHSEPI